MKQFIVTRAGVEQSDAESLMQEIVKGTGSEVEAAAVLRSLQRLGTDPSIEHYEISQVPGRRMNGGPAVNSWRVRAERAMPETDATP